MLQYLEGRWVSILIMTNNCACCDFVILIILLFASISLDSLFGVNWYVSIVDVKFTSNDQFVVQALFSYLEVEAGRLLSEDSLTEHRTARGSSGSLQQQCASVNQTQMFWEQLSMIAWCPVLTKSPVAGLPWPSQASQVAPPCQVRPKQQMWFISSCMRIFDGECR